MFDEFLQQRKKDKKPLEGIALKLILDDLKKWETEKSGNANLAISNAIKGGWKSLIEPKLNNLTPQTQRFMTKQEINRKRDIEIYNNFLQGENND